MKVELLSHTPDPEKLVAVAAKLCYSSSHIGDIYEGGTVESNAKFVRMLRKLGHESPIEHVTFTFAIEGVSRTFLAQITRHRIASYSVQSQRYVEKSNFEYIIPKKIAEIPEAKKVFEELIKNSRTAYVTLTKILKDNYIKNFLESDMDLKQVQSKAEKMAIEDARFVLPNACDTRMICTFNCRSLLNFFRLRCCNRAQWEIRSVAREMFKLVYKVAPSIFENAGPSCLYAGCSEGKMSCGKASQVRDIFDSLKNSIKNE